MLKLMKLELRKHKLGWYWKGVLIANLLIVVFMGLLPSLDDELEVAFASYEEVFLAMGTMVRVVYVIFASVLISSFIIQEYNNKTISVLFTYPVLRKKLIAAKLLLIMAITLVTILISNVMVVASFLALNAFMDIMQGTLSTELMVHQTVNMLIQGLSAVGISMVPLYFGMRKKSAAATIISSVLLIGIISSNNGGFSIGQFIAVPITVGLIGLAIAYLSFKNVDNTDIA
ncbi:ABC transporter permease [Paenibacillus sp. DMB20]|uniref:ABC transporter permease n=1 Tax=Paenibacillus sp. DMB20 TaxID=1642570 RepID=UPI00062781E7|nr:ABC transporter permease [Paenibacillus sp. DMB20]KKO50787.1 hypothetical protein XI25_30205 [Paenibacillus sp. DMB20]